MAHLPKAMTMNLSHEILLGSQFGAGASAYLTSQVHAHGADLVALSQTFCFGAIIALAPLAEFSPVTALAQTNQSATSAVIPRVIVADRREPSRALRWR
jgi:hypothetical protein